MKRRIMVSWLSTGIRINILRAKERAVKPSQPSGPTESRVWYAHDLVVPEKRETKVRESAVAAAARQALESTNSMPVRTRRPRRALWLAGVGLAGATAALMMIPWSPEPNDGPATATGTSSGVDVASAKEKVSVDVGDTDKPSAPAIRAVEKDPAVAQPANQYLATAPRPATDRTPPETGSLGQPRVAGYTATNADPAETENLGGVDPSQLPVTIARPDSDAGEIRSSRAAPEIDVIEMEDEKGETSNKNDSSSRSAGRQRKVQARANKQAAEYYETGDCAMPSWAWRVFGFSEPVKRKPSC